jgi:pyridoxal phosphate enzyme (YggS family)
VKDIKERILSVKERIATAAARAGRMPEEIVLVAVTKEAILPDLEEALKTGLLSDVGENRVQQLLDRLQVFRNYGVKVHLIGRLQRNKVKKIAGEVDLIQSLDREAILIELEKRLEIKEKKQDVLIEVNVSGEITKAGIRPEEVFEFASKVFECPHLNLRGLMMMAPFIEPQKCRPYFRKTFELFDKLRKELKKDDFDILSMGMSNDFEVAIEEGSTMVRIGTAIFKG